MYFLFPEFEVEKLIFHEKIRKTMYYLVKWKNTPYTGCTWESEETLKNCEKAIETYWIKK